MPLGFSIIGSTVAFDLFLRWATCLFLSRTIQEYKSLMKCWLNSIVVCLIWKSMNSVVHEHAHHHQATKCCAHKIKWFHSTCTCNLISDHDETTTYQKMTTFLFISRHWRSHHSSPQAGCLPQCGRACTRRWGTPPTWCTATVVDSLARLRSPWPCTAHSLHWTSHGHLSSSGRRNWGWWVCCF